ncbi:50S ribosomal protein L7/L12 domain protein [Cooperia oncophora]
MVAALSVLERGAGGDTKSQIAEALKRTSDIDVPELIRQLTAADGVLMAVATKLYLDECKTPSSSSRFQYIMTSFRIPL